MIKLPKISLGLFNTERDTKRSLGSTQKKEVQAKQKSKCAKCGKTLDPRAVHYHHKKEWASGGRTNVKNCQALCPNCHEIESHKHRLKKVEKKKTKSKGPFSTSIKMPKMRKSKFKL
jgi:5-methylcytosine-specific restriction endonuclease McrA